jgi:O-antigen/teichoic acid export membrane protein
MAILGTIYFTVDSQFLAYYSGNEILGQYQTVARLVFFTLILAELASQVFLPALAARYKFEGLNQIKIDARLLTKYLWILGLASMIFCNVFGKDLISFIFGPRYLPGLAVMLLVTSIMLIRVALTVHAILLTITDHQRTRVLIVAVTLMMAFLSNAVLVPEYGMVGAGWAGLITHLVLFGLYLYYTSRIANDIFLRFSDAIKLVVSLLAIYFLSSYFESSILLRLAGFVVVTLVLLYDLKWIELKTLFQKD